MRVQLSPDHVAVWNGSLTINYYAWNYNFHCTTMGGYTSDDPPSQLDALESILRYWNDLPNQEYDTVSHCAWCGDPSDYCQGHGQIGDPLGYEALQAHDIGDHSLCSIYCQEA